MPDLAWRCTKIKAPAAVLAAAVLAHEPIEPALKSARQIEIGAINRQHERVIDRRPHRTNPAGSVRAQTDGRLHRRVSFHSLIQEKRCRRRSVGWRIDVSTVVD